MSRTEGCILLALRLGTIRGLKKKGLGVYSSIDTSVLYRESSATNFNGVSSEFGIIRRTAYFSQTPASCLP